MIIQIDSILSVTPPTEPAEGTNLAPWYVVIQSGASRMGLSVWDRDTKEFQKAAASGAAEVSAEVDTYKETAKVKFTFAGASSAVSDVSAAFAQPYRQRKPAAE